MMNIPKDFKSLKSNLFFISLTSILCNRTKVNHPVTRLPVAEKLLKIVYNYTEYKFEKSKKINYFNKGT